MSDEVENDEVVTMHEKKVPQTAEEKAAKANAAAISHRNKLKSKGRSALQQFVPTVIRDDLREFLKLATVEHEAGRLDFQARIKSILDEFLPEVEAEAEA